MMLELAPRAVLQARGIVPGRAIAGLLDCSGFAYGDAWSTPRIDRREAHYRRLKRRGARIVMLPQAFGPFEKPDVRRASRRLLEHADLIYARDRVSLRHLEDLGLGVNIAGTVPDISHLLPGRRPGDRDVWRRRVAIVPNTRMVDRTPAATADRYRRFMLDSVRLVVEHGLEPYLLLHERNDLPLAQQIRDSARISMPIVDEDPLVSKGMLGASFAVIGSRYHALISALSQGVPAVGTSWSHKYSELFAAYGCSPYLLSLDEGDNERRATVRRLLESRATLASCLAARAEGLEREVDRMWNRVEGLFHASAHPASEWSSQAAVYRESSLK